MYIYVMPPIDMGWGKLTKIDSLPEPIAKIAKEEPVNWEGDAWTIFEFWIPSEGQMVRGYTWKQQNSGTTFIASPVELAYLDEISFDSIWFDYQEKYEWHMDNGEESGDY